MCHMYSLKWGPEKRGSVEQPFQNEALEEAWYKGNTQWCRYNSHEGDVARTGEDLNNPN